VKRFGELLALAIVLITGCGVAAAVSDDSSGSGLPYHRYLDQYSIYDAPSVEYVIEGGDFVRGENTAPVAEYGGRTGRFAATDETGFAEWEVQIEQAGLYNIEVQYHPLPGKGVAAEREITINGVRPFTEAEYLTFKRVFADAGPIMVDRNGNQIRPQQVEAPQWQTVMLHDSTGYVAQPFKFFLSEGTNTIRLSSQAEPLLIGQLRICQAEQPRSYREVSAEYAARGYEETSGVFIKVQGESAVRKSDPTLFGVFDQGDPTMEPYHPVQIRVNSIGGYRWSHANEWIAWEFSVPESGLYKVAIKAKQNQLRGFYSSRRVYIDGRVPFEELMSVAFPYSTGYLMKVLGDEETGEEYLIYLDEGQHEIKLEAVIGDLVEYIQQAKDNLYKLTSIYRQIIMITSPNPDTLRSYQLDKKIPTLVDDLKSLAASFRDIEKHFREYTGQTGGHGLILNTLVIMLDRMVDRPDRIPNLLGEFRDNIGSLGEWISDTESQPLQIDYMVIASPEQKMPRATATFWQGLVHELRAYIGSYTHDFTEIGDIATDGDERDDEEVLHVWIGLGRDQAQSLKQMIQDSFTPTTGIRVKLQLINDLGGLLVPAILAGTAPDVAIGAANMDLAFRGALADLTEFDDFDEVAKRFSKSAFVPYRLRDSVYGLPETQNFPVMFYRQDILDELGLPIPQTWDDVLQAIPVLQRNNMEIGLTGLDGNSMPNLNTLLMFLYQKGVAVYKEDCVSTNLDSRAVAFTFKQLTDFYTLYNLPLEYNIANRFRLGEMPLVITDYSLYNTLQVFAPELRGKWGFTLVPGTVQPDGSVNRAVPARSTGAIILSKSEKKDEAWEFLKWWTSKETQTAFGREMESLMGASARYASANIGAVQELPWRPHELKTLLDQWLWVEGTPPVLGGYYVTRQFDWLFRAVVIDHEPLWESIENYDEAANKEIERKRREFGYETDEAAIDEKWKALYWEQYTHVFRLELTDDELRGYGLIP
jgi:ABC-type glycerol-3-phosphate transport system substrate-binding protein